VVGPGYSRLSGDAARVTDRGGELSNPNQVDRVCRDYDMDQWRDRVTQDIRGNRDSGSGQQADQVTRVGRVTETATRSQETPARLTGLASQSKK
jgi:hypothetical protein